jgi:prepilin-type N-terminal cleavage/methylation domain-containing protein
MSSARSSRRSTDAERGFSLFELLMTAALGSIAAVAIAQFFAIQAHRQRGTGFRVELQQALRASVDTMTRDLRLAGACLPSDGDYVPLDGTDGPGADSVTIRAGIVRADLSCIVTATSALANAGATTLPVGSNAGFAPGMRVYVRHPGGMGQFTFVASTPANSVVLVDPAIVDYPVGSGLFAVDERIYSIDTSGPVPRLMLTIDQGTPQAFAAGVTDLQVRYVLERNCPPCDIVDLPPDDATWRLVNQVLVTPTVATVGATRVEDQVSLAETSRAKPRNLLP